MGAENSASHSPPNRIHARPLKSSFEFTTCTAITGFNTGRCSFALIGSLESPGAILCTYPSEYGFSDNTVPQGDPESLTAHIYAHPYSNVLKNIRITI